MLCAAFLACACLAMTGCTRDQYRCWADRDAYGLLRSRQFDDRWLLPPRNVEPDPTSRLADYNDPDCGPLPPDDPAAECYMQYPYNSRRRVRFWDRRGVDCAVDNEQWMSYLPYNEEGEVVVDKQLAVNLALLHNREFQTRVEQLHASALGLSENRFEYELNWFGGNDTDFLATDDGMDAVRDLVTTNNLGFSRNFATGGQFIANLVNAFTWSFGGAGPSNFATGNLLFSVTQPLLRGAFRHVRTESLTQAERNLLYDVRSFARFRREFYFDIVSQYFDLLNQAESVRIEKENLSSLEDNLQLHYLLSDQGEASPIQVDQVFQQLQEGRLALINSEQGLETSEDQFKFLLGLPAKVNIRIEDNLLDAFELNSPEVLQLQENVEQLKTDMNDYLPPEEAPTEFLESIYAKIKEYAAQVEELKKTVDEEFQTWQQSLDDTLLTDFDDEDADADTVDKRQQLQLAKRMKQFFLDDLDTRIEDAKQLYEKSLDELDVLIERIEPTDADEQEEESDNIKAWKTLQQLISQQGGLLDRVTTLFVTQNQIRLFLIDISPLNLEEEAAIQIALDSRLDLMNSKAAVVDAYRQVEIAADQLQSDLNLSASANLNTDGDRDNAFRFDSNDAVYNVGVQFDGPLNRFGERNVYRLAQLAYQQQRRTYMAVEDDIVNGIRLNLRQLRNNRFNFQIARQSLITATRQVDEAQLNLRQSRNFDSSATFDLLQALQTLRAAKNGLISSWISYETSRIALFVNLELLQLDEQGVWINERENFDRLSSDGVDDGGASDDESPTDNADQSSPYLDDEIRQPDFEEQTEEQPAIEGS